MKTVREVLMALVVALVSLTAINGADAQLRWGVKAGANFTTASFDIDRMTNEYLTGFHIGPTLEYQLGMIPLAIEGSVLFTQRGTKMDLEDLEDIGEGFLKTNNVEIPINAKLYFGIVPAVRMFVVAGPSFNFNLSHSLSEAYEDLGSLSGFEAKRFGFGLNAGLGIEVLKFLQISAAYNASLSNNYQYRGLGQTAQDFLDTKNKGFSVTATVLF